MQQAQLDDLGFSPSFSCYSSNSLASTAASRISTQLQQQAPKFHGVDDEEFEFSFVLGHEKSSLEYIASDDFNPQPVGWKYDALKLDEEEIACSESLEKLFITEPEEFDSSSSSESDGESPGVFCVWRHKTDAGSSPFRKCKKSGSTGSGSRRWRIRNLLRRSNSEGKKVGLPRQRRGSGEGVAVAGKLKPSVHELLYVQQRCEREGGKRRSYLPYRQSLVGFFNNVNGSGFKLPF